MLVGIKCWAAKVLLPEPAGPQRTRRVLRGTCIIFGMISNLRRPWSAQSWHAPCLSLYACLSASWLLPFVSLDPYLIHSMMPLLACIEGAPCSYDNIIG